jgi:phospholipid/cholesterol/gamma-HCH transport system permease protein
VKSRSIEEKISRWPAVTQFFETVAGLSMFTVMFFRTAFLPPYEFAEIRKHMDELGFKTMPIVTVTGFIIGLVLAMQSQPVLVRFGAESFLPAMVSLSVVRELGPVLTAIIFAGRVSSGIGAELGSMRVTEQIEAMEVSAVNPFRFLVVTRIIACTLILPILTAYAVMLAIIGAYFAILLFQSMNFTYYINSVILALDYSDYIPGISKTIFFGFIVGVVGSYKGYTAANGTVGVGYASTSAVVASSLLILLVDMVLVKITLWIWAT